MVALLTEKVGDVRPLYLEKVGDFRKKCANRAIARPKNITDNALKIMLKDDSNCEQHLGAKFVFAFTAFCTAVSAVSN